MIDTHCHLLHGLDDGSATLADAVALARSFVEAGVEGVLCTPHYSRGFATVHAQALERAAELRSALAEAGIELPLAVAAEVTPERALDAPPAELLARSVAGGYLLVEMLPDTPTISVATVFRRLEGIGLRPIYAHPERCRALRRDPSALDPARRAGALVQVVAPSLLGRWGDEAAGTGWRLVEDGVADLVASDAHRLHSRPSLSRAAELLHARVGERDTRRLTRDAPGALLYGEPLVPGAGR
jgi:protein-tyrosine phosphatase